MPERIDKSGIDKRLKSGSLLIGKSRFPTVRLRVREVDFLVSDIEISAENDRFFLLKFLHVPQKHAIPVLAVRES